MLIFLVVFLVGVRFSSLDPVTDLQSSLIWICFSGDFLRILPW